MLSPSLETRLKLQHQTIGELIAGKSEEAIRHRPIPDKWSVLENVAHLALYQTVFLDRIKTILKGSQPTFDRYVADTDPEFPGYVQKSLPGLIQSIEKVRADIHQLVTSLDSEKLALVGHHPKFGSLAIPDWVEFFLLHEAHHLFTIFKLLRDVSL